MPKISEAKVLIVATDGFEESELFGPLQILRERGAEVKLASPDLKPIPATVNDDPGKRIASLVAGASAYLVTVDGARYFVGAMLPTGHRIVAIEKTAVALERDGQKTSLKF